MQIQSRKDKQKINVDGVAFEAVVEATCVRASTWDDNGNLLSDGNAGYAYPAKSAGPAAIKPIA